MPGKFEAPRGGGRKRRKQRRSKLLWILPILLVLVIGTLIAVQWLGKPDDTLQGPTEPTGSSENILPPNSSETDESNTSQSTTESSSESTTESVPELPYVVSTATLSAQGDLLMHKPVINTGAKRDGSYDYESIFRYVAPYVSAFDYAAVNLETTLGGANCGIPYQGNPLFNCPDPIVDSVVEAGYDMLLTANNHSSDTKAAGIIRTLEQARGVGLATLGTMLNDEEQKYSIIDVNGIQIGMLCYTYATGVTSDGRPSLNGNSHVSQAGIVNYFMENNLSKFYSEVEEHIANMKAGGAEAIIFYIHWGIEYQIKENSTQQAIAQKLCDLGVDVIVGGHPHVVQPVALLESTVDPSHKSVCIYSLGNAVSNQRTGVSKLFPDGYTEDGALFTVTFEKYSDGSVYLAGTDVIPTWVNMHANNGVKEYNILPLDISREDEWIEIFDLTKQNFSAAQKSYDRTMGIVGDGLAQCQEYLAQAKAERDQMPAADTVLPAA